MGGVGRGARAVTSQNALLHTPSQLPSSGHPGSYGSARWGRLPGASGGRSVLPTSGFPILRVSGASPSPRCRCARAPSQAPCAPHTGSFRLGSPRSPLIPWIPSDPHPSIHTTPSQRFHLWALSLPALFHFRRFPLLPSAGLPIPPFPLGPSLLLIRREQCPGLGAGSRLRSCGLSGLGFPGRLGLGLRPGSLPLSCASRWA